METHPASLADLAVITEVIRNVSASNPNYLRTITAEIKDVLLRNSPSYSKYIEEMDSRMTFMDTSAGNISPESIKVIEDKREKDLLLIKEVEREEVSKKIIADLQKIASGKASVLDMTLAGFLYGMSKWAADLFMLTPQLLKESESYKDTTTLLKNWLKVENNLFFLSAWIIIIIVIVVIV